MRYFSMFSGVGGFEYGIEQAIKDKRNKSNIPKKWKKDIGNAQNLQQSGNNSEFEEWKCIGCSEIDKYAIQTYQKHFPSHRNFGDAAKINPNELPDFDMLCGGFPCQAFSIAGKRRGFQDTRGTLFFEIARIIKAKRPKIILLENVKGLLNHDKGKTFRVIIQTLSELGYDVQWMVLNSKFFGVPQNRERVFIIGSIRGTSKPEILPFREKRSNFNEQSQEEHSKSQTITATYWKGGKGTNIQVIDCYNKKIRNEIPTLSDPMHNNIRLVVNSEREYSRIYSPEGIAPALHLKTGGWQEPKIYMNTITEAVGTRQGSSKEFLKSVENIKNSIGKIRRLTPVECERLQGFPDNWTEGVSDTQRYIQMGNAVTANVIREIIKRLEQENLNKFAGVKL